MTQFIDFTNMEPEDIAEAAERTVLQLQQFARLKSMGFADRIAAECVSDGVEVEKR